MRRSYLTAIVLVGLFGAVPALGAAGLSVTMSPSMGTAKPGARVDYTLTVTNVLAKREPITLQATCDYTDWNGVAQQTAAASLTLEVIQPLSPGSVAVAVPSSVTYVAGSAKVDGTAVTPVIVPGLVKVPITRTLNEGESCKIELGVLPK